MADVLEREASRFLGRSTIPAAGRYFTPAEMSRSFSVTERYNQTLNDLDRAKTLAAQEAEIQDLLLARRQRELNALKTDADISTFDETEEMKSLNRQTQISAAKEALRTAPDRARLGDLSRRTEEQRLLDVQTARENKPLILRGLKNLDYFSSEFDDVVDQAARFADEDPDIARAVETATRRRGVALRTMDVIARGSDVLPAEQRETILGQAREMANKGDYAGLQSIVASLGASQHRFERAKEVVEESREFRQNLRNEIPSGYHGTLSRMFNRIQVGDERSMMGALKDAQGISQGLVKSAQKTASEIPSLKALSGVESDRVLEDIRTSDRETFINKYFQPQPTSSSNQIVTEATRNALEMEGLSAGLPEEAQAALSTTFQTKQREVLGALYDKIHRVLQAPIILMEQRAALLPVDQAASPAARNREGSVDAIFEEAQGE